MQIFKKRKNNNPEILMKKQDLVEVRKLLSSTRIDDIKNLEEAKKTNIDYAQTLMFKLVDIEELIYKIGKALDDEEEYKEGTLLEYKFFGGVE